METSVAAPVWHTRCCLSRSRVSLHRIEGSALPMQLPVTRPSSVSSSAVLLKDTPDSSTDPHCSERPRYSQIRVHYTMIRHEMDEKQVAHQLLIELLVYVSMKHFELVGIPC